MKTLIIGVNDKNALSEAVKILKKGGIVIYPTETCYGMGVDATNEIAINKLVNSKGRKQFAAKPISIIVSGMKMIKKYAFLNEDAEILMKKFMPGPLTLVIRKRKLPDMLSKKTIAFRIPSDKFALRLVKRYNKPITATSANLSGEPALYKINDVKKTFQGRVELIIDAGNLPKRKPSTIFDTASKKVLRKGTIKGKMLMNALKGKDI